MTKRQKWYLQDLKIQSFVTRLCHPYHLRTLAVEENRGGGGQISNPTCGEDRCSNHCY